MARRKSRIRRLFSSARPKRSRGACFSRLLRHEQLEDRRVLAVLTVNSFQDNTTSGDGLVTLREAIVAANTDAMTDLDEQAAGADTIVFDPVVFATPQTIALGNSLRITGDTTIDGPGADQLVLDGFVRFGFRFMTVLYVSGGSVTINGLSITGGNQGIKNSGTLTLNQSAVYGNESRDVSGAGINNQGTLTLNQSTVYGNSSPGGGGGLASGGVLTLNQSTVHDNSADTGGGVWNAGTLTLNQSTVSNNTSRLGAGGIYNQGSYAVAVANVINSTLSGNSAPVGGGIFNQSAVMNVVNSTLAGNTAGQYGGAIHNSVSGGSMVTLTNSTVVGNSAGVDGGGIFNNGATVDIDHSIVAGNSASGMDKDVHNLNNSNPGGGAGIVNTSYSFVGAASGDGMFNDLGGNLLSTTDWKTVVENDGTDPTLADNGGPTLTLALLPGSPAINAGDPMIAMPPMFDQRGAGFARVSGGQIDIGAVEVQLVESLLVTTIYDENNGTSDPRVGTGTSLREALAYANAHPGADTITFDAMVFATPQTITLGGTQLTITDDLVIDGPGADQLAVSGNHASRVFQINTGADVTIAGLTITKGSAQGGQGVAGGGIYNFGTLTLNRSTVSGNSASDGGAIAIEGTLTLNHSTISGNTAYESGGGIANRTGTLTLTQSTVTGNTAGEGGGIWNQGTLALNQTTVSDNSAIHGGGILNQSYFGVANVINSTLSGNTSETNGGAVINQGIARMNVENSTLAGNTARLYGGAINNSDDSMLTLTSSTVVGNSAGADGGGIVNFGATVDIDHSIVAGNSVSGMDKDVDNRNNSNPGGGAGIVNTSYSFVGAASGDGTFNNLGGNLPSTTDWMTVVENDGIDPTLADNGGPTLTVALRPGSDAINAGDSMIAMPPMFDQRGAGFDRVVGGRIDIGAVEVQNQAPVANDDQFTIDEDTTLAGNVLIDNGAGADFDPNGDMVTVVLLSDVTHGTLMLNPADGTFTYDPNEDFNGSDSFTYKLNDGLEDSYVATVSITVLPVNDPPVAYNDTATTNEDEAVTIDILDNDNDVDDIDSPTVIIFGDGTHGHAAVNPDGTVTYTPNPDFNGSDTFTYFLNDGEDDSNVATVTVTVHPVNDPPTINSADAVDVDENTAVVMNVEASDVDGDTEGMGLTFSLTGGADQTLFSIDPNTGELSFIAAPDYEDPADDDSDNVYNVQVTVTDSTNLADVQDIAVTVLDVNEAPMANDDMATTAEDVAVTITVLDNDSDPEGDMLSVTSTTDPDHGTVAINADGTITYTPDVDFHGVDQFMYTLEDEGGLTDTAWVTVTVLSPTEQIENLIAQVGMLFDDGVLNGGQANSLTTKLEHIQTKLDNGQTHVALNILNAFINQVTDLIDDGVLTPDQGQPLIDAAADLRMSLETVADEHAVDLALAVFGADEVSLSAKRGKK